MYESHPLKRFLMELLNVFGVILLGLCKAVKVVFLAFVWVIIVGCAITKNR